MAPASPRPGSTRLPFEEACDASGRVMVMVDQELGITEKYAYSPEGLRTRIEVYHGATLETLMLQKVKVSVYNDQRQLVTKLEAN